MNKTLTLVVPCYNEFQIIESSCEKLTNKLNELIDESLISENSILLLVDDGSSDNTWSIIEKVSKKYGTVKGVKLSHNVGHQKALYAGLCESKTEMTISLDADLQDDINAIKTMIEQHYQGYEIVYGVRKSRISDSFFKRNSAKAFYWFLNKFNSKQIENHADYRLLGRAALNALLGYKESNLYIRGLIPQLGFNCTSVYYERKIREAGESKYPLRKMLSLALTAITSTTTTPLRLITYIGLIIALLSFAGGMYAIYVKLTMDSIDGWASLMTSIFFLGGVQLTALGIIGEYVGRIYIESKHRPKFIIEDKT
ncbi:glycosyltransferase family 2 protein [Vibrio breoganii]|uniref:glycosyltransferase family 2 protein n=1 Tax=Vibrio breoganii TaxID=553239 RepID=UPI0002FADF34|nr:glycosyltransferase family 2 protein [Vibrio breoganii]OED98338.1 glycosyltransferase [Vibrio breoganii ZF-29]OEF81185.1 glycosyltransferase [Vibrio breoganii 1C10]PMG94623.1 glycosyltransferase [Vibrio breoganii]PMM80968.1 glycosyltransferase [Vibrio breoganii]TKF88555.1 glycosyltransferase family 2 protein [Vibrio breoganii]